MTIRDKIIAALPTIPYDEISDEILLDILIDAQRRLKAKLELEEARCSERIAHERHINQVLEADMRRKRNDPTYFASGTYFFICRGRKMCVNIKSGHVEMFERDEEKGIDFFAQPMNSHEFSDATKK